jgi:acetyl esterase/lipase
LSRTPLSDVAPELRRRVRLLPPLPLGTSLGRRATRGLTVLGARRGTVDGVRLRELPAGAVRLRVFTPDGGVPPGGARAALLWVHGGGFVTGTPLQDDRFCAATARDLGVVVASVRYRLAPEHPFPAGVDDAFAAWVWLRQNAAALGADPARIAVGGQSAGGGLAACAVQRIHDAGAGTPVAQWLFSPMLDDRTAARDLDGVRHRVWDNGLNRIGWRAYLGMPPGAAGVPAYAAAARRTDLAGLPPAWIGVGTVDLFHDEGLAYAAGLRAAGVDCTLDVVPGAPHGFESWAADTAPARDFVARARSWLDKALD